MKVKYTVSSELARQVSFGELPNVLIPAARVPRYAPLELGLWEAQRPGVRDMPGHRSICPFVPKAFAAGAVFGGFMIRPKDVQDVVEAMRAAVALLPEVRQGLGDHRDLASLVVVVPSSEPVRGSRLVEAAHRLVKPEAVATGALIGEFGRALGGPGTRFTEVETRRLYHGEQFVVRTLVPADVKYMDHPATLAAFRARIRSE